MKTTEYTRKFVRTETSEDLVEIASAGGGGSGRRSGNARRSATRAAGTARYRFDGIGDRCQELLQLQVTSLEPSSATSPLP